MCNHNLCFIVLGNLWGFACRHLGVHGFRPVRPTLIFLSVTCGPLLLTFSPIGHWLPGLGHQPPCCHFDNRHRSDSITKFPISPPLSLCNSSVSECLSVVFSFRSSLSWSFVPCCLLVGSLCYCQSYCALNCRLPADIVSTSHYL